ncbi:MAG: hypothetical protein J6C46_02260 [Clostridia bacterium]|nr:hypothetical protein [Clostridia bacterium]
MEKWHSFNKYLVWSLELNKGGLLKMLGKVMMFIILLVFIITFTAMDIINLRKGIGGYIQRPSGMLFTTLCLMVIPMGVFDLRGGAEVGVTIILEMAYMLFYTGMYFKIKEERNSKK